MTTERMDDERLEDIKSLADDGSDLGQTFALELLAEVVRLRAAYEPTPVTVAPAVTGTYDIATGTLRVTLAAWLQYGPQRARGGLVSRVELTDREPRETHPVVRGVIAKEAGPAYWWLAHNLTTPERLPRDWFPTGHTGALFATREEALAWASEAAIRWAKEQPDQSCCGQPS